MGKERERGVWVFFECFKCSATQKPTKTNEYNFLFALKSSQNNNIRYNPNGPFKLKSLSVKCMPVVFGLFVCMRGFLTSKAVKLSFLLVLNHEKES